MASSSIQTNCSVKLLLTKHWNKSHFLVTTWVSLSDSEQQLTDKDTYYWVLTQQPFQNRPGPNNACFSWDISGFFFFWIQFIFLNNDLLNDSQKGIWVYWVFCKIVTTIYCNTLPFTWQTSKYFFKIELKIL